MRGTPLKMVTNKLKQIEGIELIVKKLLGKADQVLCEYLASHDIDLTDEAFSHTRIHDLLLGSFTAKS